MSLVPRFLGLRRESPRLKGGRRTRQRKPWAVSGQQAPCGLGRETFTGPGNLLGAPRSPACPAPAASPPPSRDRSFLPRSLGGEAGWGRGFIQDPAPGKAAPPFSLSASAPRIFPSLRRWWMGRSATLQRQQLLLPSLGGCPGRHCRQRPPLRSLRMAREDPTHTTIGPGARVCSAPLSARCRARTSSGQRGILAEKAAAAAARKRRPGGCCYPTPPTRSGCNTLGPASARLLPACAGWCAPPSVAGLLPFAALPSSSARPAPALLTESGSSRRRLGGRRCGTRFTGTQLRPPSTRQRL